MSYAIDRKPYRVGIFIVIISLVIGGLWYVYKSNMRQDILTEEERLWLEQHPNLRIAPDPYFPPLEYFDERGEYRGLIADYFDIIQTRLGYRFVLSRCGSWNEVIEQAKSRRIDIITAAQITPERQTYMLFTSPIVDIPNVIITQSDVNGSITMSMLEGKDVAITQGNAIHEYIQEKFPKIHLKLVTNDLNALTDVSFGRAYATVVNLAIASYYIEQQGISNLRVAGDSGKSNALAIASRNDMPILNQILEKGLAAITLQEKQQLQRKWIGLSSKEESIFTKEEFKSAIIVTALSIGFLVLLLVFWNNTLKREVNQRTADLNNELLKRKQIEEKLRKQSEYLTALNEVTIGLINRFDLNELLREIVQRASRLMDTEHGFLYFIDLNGNFLELKVGTGVYRKHLGFRLHFGEGISGKVWESGKSMIVDDLQTYEGRSINFVEDNVILHAIAVAALKSDEQIYGTIGVGYTDKNKKIVSEELEILERFAYLASLAMENARLYDALQYELAIRKKAEEEVLSLNATLEQKVRERTAQLEAANRELDSFSYSISHDLRAPLRTLDGFSQALLEDYEAVLDDQGKRYLHRIRNASQHMAQLIDEILKLSRLSRSQLNREYIDIAQIGREIIAELQTEQPKRKVAFLTPPTIRVFADPFLMRVALTNLISNAWKFTSKHTHAIIELGTVQDESGIVYYVKDDGAGFDMAYADKLFSAFQRLHSKEEFDGNGIGLAIVQRIIHRHGGKIWAESEVEKGATFYFTLEKEPVA